MDNPFEIIEKRLDNIESILTEINKKLETKAITKKQEDKLLTIEEVTSYLSLAKSSIYGKVQRRAIPCIKSGKRLYFKKSEIDEWLNKRRRKTSDELRIEAEEYCKNKT